MRCWSQNKYMQVKHIIKFQETSWYQQSLKTYVSIVMNYFFEFWTAFKFLAANILAKVLDGFGPFALQD